MKSFFIEQFHFIKQSVREPFAVEKNSVLTIKTKTVTKLIAKTIITRIILRTNAIKAASPAVVVQMILLILLHITKNKKFSFSVTVW